MRKNAANIVTSCRILFSIGMLFLPLFSPRFLIAYLICGLTDMIDGTIARKTNTASAFGSKLDTAADFIFASAALFKILPRMELPVWLWLWIGIIAVIKAGNVIWGFLCRKRFLVRHSALNRIAGTALFFFPVTFLFIEPQYGSIVVCSIATLAAIQEGVLIRAGTEVSSTISGPQRQKPQNGEQPGHLPAAERQNTGRTE